MDPKSSDLCLYERKDREIYTERHREGHVKTETEIGVTLPRPRNARGHEKLEERGKSSLEFSGDVWPR